MSKINFMLSRVEQEKRIITSGPDDSAALPEPILLMTSLAISKQGPKTRLFRILLELNVVYTCSALSMFSLLCYLGTVGLPAYISPEH